MNTTAIINIAKQQLGMDEDVYRALLTRVTGQSSLKAMTGRQHIAVIEEMKRLGFRVKSGEKPMTVTVKPYIRLIHALWRSCHRLDIIQDGSRTALRAFVKERSSVDDPDFLTFEQADPIIKALKAMERRGGKTTHG